MYTLQVNQTIVQRSRSIMDLQRIAANLDISHYLIIKNHEVVYKI